MLKAFILWLHKWLVIFRGVVITIVALTGCLYTFQDEFKLWAYPEKYFIQQTKAVDQSTPLKYAAIKSKKGA